MTNPLASATLAATMADDSKPDITALESLYEQATFGHSEPDYREGRGDAIKHMQHRLGLPVDESIEDSGWYSLSKGGAVVRIA